MPRAPSFRNEQIVLEFFEALYRADRDEVLAHLSDDVEPRLAGILPASGRHIGKEAITGELLEPFGPIWDGRSQAHSVKNLIAAGDDVAVELIGGGRTAAGSNYENLYCFVVRVGDDGKITRVRAYTDTGDALGRLCGPLRRAPSYDD
jgi:ketosteroid isomerase-like protein